MRTVGIRRVELVPIQQSGAGDCTFAMVDLLDDETIIAITYHGMTTYAWVKTEADAGDTT